MTVDENDLHGEQPSKPMTPDPVKEHLPGQEELMRSSAFYESCLRDPDESKGVCLQARSCG